jgi:hypothetical protein
MGWSSNLLGNKQAAKTVGRKPLRNPARRGVETSLQAAAGLLWEARGLRRGIKPEYERIS